MPIYEYACQKCGATVEKIQKYSDPPLARCAACGGALERLLSSPAIQFKGSGWYITDYARKSGADAGKNGSASATKSEPEAAKPAAPPSEKPATETK